MNRIINKRFVMNKRLSWAIAAAVIIIILMIGLLIKTISNRKAQQLAEIASMSSTNIIIENVGDIGEDGNIEVDVTIPHFKNLSDSYNFYINDLIKDRFNYKRVFKEFVAGMKNADLLRFKYNVDYERYDYYDFISIIINEYAELEGDRPRITKTCYVINAKDSRTASLGDAFETNKDYKKIILEEINKQAKKNNIEFMGDNELTILSEFQSFYIKDEKLHIFFEASSVAANSFGDLDFEMPFEASKGKFII